MNGLPLQKPLISYGSTLWSIGASRDLLPSYLLIKPPEIAAASSVCVSLKSVSSSADTHDP